MKILLYVITGYLAVGAALSLYTGYMHYSRNAWIRDIVGTRRFIRDLLADMMRTVTRWPWRFTRVTRRE